MQYTQLKHVIDIDHRITNLHKELSGLYAKRALFLGTSGLSVLQNNKTLKNKQDLNDPWVIHTYSYLVSAWTVHGIAIPSMSSLEKKLLKSRRIIERLTAIQPELDSQLGVLLVPPSSLMPLAGVAQLRHNQAHVLLPDYINPDLLNVIKTPKKNWQVLVAYMGTAGLDYGSAAKIVRHNKHLIGGYDTNALGIRQYIALSLQINQAIDQNVWTILLGQKLTTSVQIPSVTFLKGQYRFELDEPNSILGDERYRPAVDIKG